MANIYMDPVGGDDTTGFGTLVAPWKTLEKCTTGLTGGDEVRIKKLTPTALTGTLTFTNGSTTVNTSSDLTTEIAAGDVIGKNTGNEGWWRVTSLTASVITLTYAYWGASGTTSAYKATGAAIDEAEVNSSGLSLNNRLKITGGWNFSSDERDGFTFLTRTTGNIGIDGATRSYVEVSYIVVINAAYESFLFTGSGNWIHHCYSSASARDGIDFGSSTDSNKATNNILAGSGYDGIAFSGNPYRCVIEDNYLYTCGPNTSYHGIRMGDGATSCSYNGSIRRNYIYNGNYSIVVTGAYNVIASNTIGGPKNTGHCIMLNPGASKNSVYNNSISDLTSGSFWPICASSAYSNYCWDNTFTNCTNSGYGVLVTVTDPIACAFLVRQQDGSYNIIGANYSVYSNTAESRSGTCLRLGCTAVAQPAIRKLGVATPTTNTLPVYLKVYVKKDGTFNGTFCLFAVQNGGDVGVYPVTYTLTTSYVEYTLTIPSGNFVSNFPIELICTVSGTAGYVYIDDFSAAQ